MFENIALLSQGFVYEGNELFPSSERKTLSFGKYNFVKPDGVRSVHETTLRTWLGIPYGNSTMTYPKSSFFEVKAVAGWIRLSSSGYQIQGELDAVSNSVGATQAGRGTMTFITTANTFIHPNVISYANKKHIQLYQVFAFEETDDGSIRFSPPIPLNNPRIGRSTPINVTPLGKIFDLTRPYYLNSGIKAEPPATIDPEEVE